MITTLSHALRTLRLCKPNMRPAPIRCTAAHGAACVTAVAALMLSAATAQSSTFTNGLQIRFRADRGVKASASYQAANGELVAYWQSDAGDTPLTVMQSSTGLRPIWVKDAFARGGGSFSPAVRFNRDLADTVSYSAHWMGSTNNTRLNLGASSTWFVVMNLLDDNLQTSLFGFPESTARYGAFFLNTPSPANLLRTYNSGPYTAAQMTQRVPSLVDNRRSGSLLNTCLNGLSVGQNTSASGAALSTDQQFRIGAMLNDVTGRPKADIAEVIVYNRALNDAERVIVQNALAAQYGLALGANDLYTGKDVAEGNFDLDVVGIGKFADAGATAMPGVALESGDARGLRLTALNGSLATDGEFLFAGHNSLDNGWTGDDTDGVTCARRWQRSWKVQKISGDGIDARLTFDFTAAGGVKFVSGAPYRLLYRADATSAFVALAANATEDGQSLYFDLADSVLLSGEYTVGAAEVTQPEPGLNDGLTLWFRADTVLSGEGATNGAPVAAWSNFGSLTEVADVAAAAEENRPSFRAEGFERASGVYEPVVRFNWDAALNAPTADNLHRLTTGERVTDCGITEDSTWFLVFKTLAINRDLGIFGGSDNESRFGAFFVGSMDNRLRFQNNMYAYQVYEYNMPNQTVMVMDSRRYGPKSNAYLSTRGNGSPGGDFALDEANVFAAAAAQFRIGTQHFASPSNNLVGDVAEIRVYNRALNDAERVIVQNHLAARYGKTLEAYDVYKGKEAAAGDYDLDVVGIGCMTESGLAKVPGSVTDSGDLAGLRLLALGGTLASHNEFVFAGHRTAANAWTSDNTDGVTCTYRWSRDWYVNRSSSTVALQPSNDGIDVRLVFCRLSGGIAEPPYGGDYRLLFRRKLTDAYEALPVAAQAQGGLLAFDLTADSLVNGYYTLGTGVGAPDLAGASLCAGIGRGLRAWFRAADAVTLDGGAVAEWGNLGLSGSVLDVQPSSGAPQLVSSGFERAAGVYEPAVRFSNNERLVTAGLTDFDVVDSLTWFVVLRPDGTLSSRANTGVFGLDNDGTSRLGAFFTGTAPFYPLRGHAFCDNNIQQFCQTTTLVQNVTQIADHRRLRLVSSYAIEARLNGGLGERKTGSQAAPQAGRFKIGHMLADTWGSAFKGDFAELRVYNRALMDAERVIIQNHLAARYGAELDANDVYAGKGAAAGDYDLDVVGIGCTTNAVTYDAPGAVVRSESSAGLTLEALGGSLDEDGEFLLAGHTSTANGWVFSGVAQTGVSRRWQREWYLDKTSAAGLDVSMAFDFDAAGVSLISQEDEPVYLLLWRADAASGYVDTGVIPDVEGNTLTFTVPNAALADGLYTVGVLLPARGTLIKVQ